jgi:hypothetical protein
METCTLIGLEKGLDIGLGIGLGIGVETEMAMDDHDGAPQTSTWKTPSTQIQLDFEHSTKEDGSPFGNPKSSTGFQNQSEKENFPRIRFSLDS